jgi:hypothetical protein
MNGVTNKIMGHRSLIPEKTPVQRLGYGGRKRVTSSTGALTGLNFTRSATLVFGSNIIIAFVICMVYYRAYEYNTKPSSIRRTFPISYPCRLRCAGRIAENRRSP